MQEKKEAIDKKIKFKEKTKKIVKRLIEKLAYIIPKSKF